MQRYTWHPAGEGRDAGHEGDEWALPPDERERTPPESGLTPVEFADARNPVYVGAVVQTARVRNIPLGWTFYSADNTPLRPAFESDWRGTFNGVFSTSNSFFDVKGYSEDFSAVVDFQIKTGVDLDFNGMTKAPGVGNVVVQSNTPIRSVGLVNTAGATILTISGNGETSAQLNFVPEDTYSIKVIGADGSTRRISGVQVVAGRSSAVTLTPASETAPPSEPAEEKPPASDEGEPTGSEDPATEPPPSEDPPVTARTHTLALLGLQQGDRATLLRGTEEIAPVIAQGNAVVQFLNLPDGDYVLHVSFTTGTMVNRVIALDASSSSMVSFNFAEQRGAKEEKSYVVPALLGTAAVGGGIWYYLKYVKKSI